VVRDSKPYRPFFESAGSLKPSHNSLAVENQALLFESPDSPQTYLMR
jgi:hypothetical protein